MCVLKTWIYNTQSDKYNYKQQVETTAPIYIIQSYKNLGIILLHFFQILITSVLNTYTTSYIMIWSSVLLLV